MAVQVVTCKECSMRYNGAEYSDCPFCKGTGKLEKKPGSHSGGAAWSWPKRKKKVSEEVPEKPITMVVEQEESGYYNNTPANNNGGVVRPTVGFTVEEDEEETIKAHSANSEIINDYNNDEMPAQVPNAIQTEPVLEQESPKPKHQQSLSNQIQRLGKTTAMLINTSSSEEIYPTVGWLVAVKGKYYGKSFPLRNGVNRVGRSPEFEVALLNEDNVSRQSKLEIIFDKFDQDFNALADNGANCVINGKRVFSNDRITLKKFDEISLGDKRENLFLFIPLWGDEFDWNKYPQEK